MELIILLFSTLIILLFISVPVGIALGLSAVIVAMFSDIDMILLAQKFLGSGDSFSLLAIPFFILAGSIMTSGGVSQRIVAFARAIVGSKTGGLAQVTLLGCLFFSALSGSSAATTAAVGGIMIPSMVKHNYPVGFAAGVTAVGGALGPIIPPSILLIIYGVATQQSITELFLAGIGPGLLMYFSLAFLTYVISKKNGYKGEGNFSSGEVSKTFKDGFWALLMPVIILGGIYGGVFTPTESAAFGAFYGFLISFFLYKELTIKRLGEILIDSAKSTAMVMFILFAAGFFGWLLVYHNIPQTIAEGLLQITTNATLILILIALLLLVVGTFMNAQPALLILAPIFYPTSVQLGIDPVYFGLIMVMALVIGVVTPPVGVDLFVAAATAKIPFEKVSKSAMPFVLILILDVILVILFPDIAMLIPKLAR